MIAMIKRRPNQVIHTRIDNGEFLLTAVLDVANSCEQYTGVSDQESPWFEQDSQFQFAQRRQNCIGILLDGQGTLTRAFTLARIPPFLGAAFKRGFVNDS